MGGVVVKPLSLILAFLPLIAFSLLARWLPAGDFGIAALVAAVIALLTLVTARPMWPPKILQACSAVLFTLLAIVGVAVGHDSDRWLSRWAGAGVGIVIGLVILALIPIMPFTEQFARETAPKATWSSPVFRRINRGLSIAWGLAIVGLGISRVIAAIIGRHTPHSRLLESAFSAVIPVVVIVYMLGFSERYPDRVAHETSRPDRPSEQR
jgi:hypothetical protein